MSNTFTSQLMTSSRHRMIQLTGAGTRGVEAESYFLSAVQYSMVPLISDHKHHVPRDILYAPSGLPCNHQTDIRGAHSLSLVVCLMAMTLTGNRGCCASRSKNSFCASFAVHASHLDDAIGAVTMQSPKLRVRHQCIIFRSIGMTWYRDAF